MGKCYDDTGFGEDEEDYGEGDYGEDDYEGDYEGDYEFGRRRRRPRRKVKGRSHIMVRGRKRKLYRGKKGALFYRTRSGRTYIKGRKRSRFGEMEQPEYTDVEFGARLPATKVLKVLQEIADNMSPDFKYSSQLGRSGRPKLLTADALKRKLTKNNIDWKRMLEIAITSDPRYVPTRGQKFKGGLKYLRMVANRWFGIQFKYSDKVDKKGRSKLLTESALKKKLLAAFKYLGKDWRSEANTTRDIVLEIYKNLKMSFQNSGMKKTNATKLANKIMKDNEDGISMGPQLWYEIYKADVEKGDNPENAATDATSVLIRTPPLADAAALPPMPIGKGGRQSGYENFLPPRPGSMAERWQMDADSGYLGQSAAARGPIEESPYARAIQDMRSRPPPARSGGMGYRAFIDGLIAEGIRPGSEEMGRREDEWRARRAAASGSYNPPDAPMGTVLPPLRAPARGMFGGGDQSVSLPVGGPGGGNPFNNDLSERLLGFGMHCNKRSTRRR
jgi:hypothetical protein